MRRPKIGDVFELKTSKGLGYLQYCFFEGGDPGASYGYLIRMIEGLHQSSEDPALVAMKSTLFWTYFALGAALHHRLVRRCKCAGSSACSEVSIDAVVARM